MKKPTKTETIGAFLRNFRNRWRGEIVDITDLCEYAKLLKEPLPEPKQGVAHA